MCGINGMIRFNGDIEIDELSSMNESIKHRGPDDDGVFVYNGIDYSVGLGHVRLSILDLSEKGHQPMGYVVENDKIIYNDNDLNNADIVIAYNGEVYNYLELKEKYHLKTETGTDTEIILKLYAKFGFDCVKEFNGMWAFCIFDKRKNIIFCSRDRLGIKPFYYYFNENSKEFIFSSELKGIISVKPVNKKENINKDAVGLYFALGFIPSPYSIYKNVFKLESRQNLIFDLNSKEIKKNYYWELPQYNPIHDKNKLIEEGKKLLYDAVKLRMRSDVPVGAFLSGGLDSSTVVGVMKEYTDLKNLHTFSIGFEGKYDETPYINIVKDYFKTNHHHHYFKEEDFEELIDKYSWIYDEPFGDYSGFPTYKVSEMAKQFVTVCLSGDGGDEVFGGYKFHLISKRIEYLKKIPISVRMIFFNILNNNLLKKNPTFYLIKEAIKLSLIKNYEKFYSELLDGDFIISSNGKIWIEKNLKYCLNKTNSQLSESIRVFDLLFRTLSDNFLVKVDRASMANALEVRSPFLDYRFAEFSQKIPNEYKVDFFKTKKLMRKIIKDILPDEIVNRGKGGFEPPLDKWILDDKYRGFLENGLNILEALGLKSLAKFYKNKIFGLNQKYIKNAIKDNKICSIYKIRLFLFAKWWERWINTQ
ncbi:asparagine synthase (glutamine-hydrolyzing) [Methanothermococcus okinawensis]|uniref:Putative asparagine synthetase [glutamine-hydrolyzing] n=1 Tax=Methanothermococcus okinawensis (strain DSM 14208 / JCM 11175 / IH1) TaxID=647113 RepID=F8AML0_METOI|nr:asparagine synthase (glutamine-hydrolyzing) [Methanothermococcus okinawensis]AEH06051.1 asparagine synthase (glutamine-hydrolyzing) [Methanothermococcus okinawensis IH1]